MKKTQRTDARRNIERQGISYLSIVIIAMLAVLTFLAISYTVKALNYSISNYYENQNFQDVTVISPSLLTEEDLEAISTLDGVSGVEGADKTGAYLHTKDALVLVNAVSLPKEIGLPNLLEGSFPASVEECAVESGLAENYGFSIGSVIRLEDKSGKNAPLLSRSEFTVTGIFQNPENASYKVPVTYDVVVLPDAFDQSLLNNNFLQARITLSDLPEDHFSNEYTQQVAAFELALSSLADERKDSGDGTMLAYYEEQVRAGEQELADAKQRLDDAARDLEDGEKLIIEKEALIAESEAQLAEGEQKLQDAQNEIAEKEALIEDGEAQLAEGERKLLDAQNEIAEKEALIEDGEAQLAEGEQKLLDAQNEIAEKEALIEDGEAQLAEGEQKLLDAQNEIAEKEALIEDGEAQLAEGEQKLLDAQNEIAEKEALIADGEMQLANAALQIADGEAQLEAGREELRTGEEKLAAGEEALAEAEEKAKGVPELIEKGRADLEAAAKQLGIAPLDLATGESQLLDAKRLLQRGKEELDVALAKLNTSKELLDTVEGWMHNGVSWLREHIREEDWPDDIGISYSEAFERIQTEGIGNIMAELYEKSGYNAGVAEYESGLERYINGLKEYEKGRNDYYFMGEEYLDGLTAYENGKRQLEEAEAKLAELDQARDEVAQGRNQVQAGREELMEKEAELAAAKEEFATKSAELEEGKKALEDGKAEYQAGRKEYEEKLAELEEGKKALEEGKAEFETGKKEYEEKVAELKEGKKALEDGKAEFEAGRKEYEEKLAELEEGKKALEDGKAEYQAGRKEYEEKLAELEEGKKALEEGKAEFEAGKKEYEEKLAELEEGKKALEEGKAEFEAGRKEYEASLAATEIGERKLEDGRKLLDQVRDGSWIILNNKANSGYVYAADNTKNLKSICLSFSMIFIIVGALVIFATIGRMVDEQSKLVGTTKALGFTNREVLRKYQAFGVTATLIGVLLGIVTAYFVLQRIILYLYADYYTVPEAKPAFELSKTLIVLFGSLLLADLSVRLACNKLVKSSAISLLQGLDPVSKRKNRKVGSRQRRLYSRLILLNMTSDLKRVIVTIVSIAGCCILLMIGFSLKYGMDRIPERQYGGIITFDAEITFDDEISPTAKADLSSLLEDLGTDFTCVYQNKVYFSRGGNTIVATAICADTDVLGNYYQLNSILGKKEALGIPEHGILITKRMHEEYHLDVDDNLTLLDTSMNHYEAPVEGIFNNYFGHMIVFSRNAWKEAFGSDPGENCFYVRLNGITEKELEEKVSNIPGFMSLKDAASSRTQIQQTASIMNLLIVLMIGIAAIMAYFVLTNLTGSYMIHKKKELTIMRINGFTTKECIRYAATELIITTVIGILIGLSAGTGLAYLIIRLMEQPYLQIVRTVDWRSIVFSVLITGIFSLFVNWLSLREVRDLKLSDMV